LVSAVIILTFLLVRSGRREPELVMGDDVSYVSASFAFVLNDSRPEMQAESQTPRADVYVYLHTTSIMLGTY
jgi:hypothetical protein